jgi:hypothetical protein
MLVCGCPHNRLPPHAVGGKRAESDTELSPR